MKRLLSCCVGFRLPRTQHSLALAQAFEILPATLGMHFAPSTGQDPLGYFATSPLTPIRGRFLQRRDELLLPWASSQWQIMVRVSCFVQTSLPRSHSWLVLQSSTGWISLPDCPSVGSQSASHRLPGSRKRQVKERWTLVKHVSAFTWRNDLRQNPQTLFRCQGARTSVSRLSRLSLNRHSVNTQCMSTTALSTRERNGTFIPSAFRETGLPAPV